MKFPCLSQFHPALGGCSLPRSEEALDCSKNSLCWVVTFHWRNSITAFAQFSSVAQSCLTLCDPMDYSMPGFPVHHQLPELTQTHVHQVSDPSNHLILCRPLLLLPLVFPSIKGFFQWVSSSHQVAKVLEFQRECQYFQLIFRNDFL